MILGITASSKVLNLMPFNVTPPSVTGTLEVGATLTGDVGVWLNDPTFVRAWLLNIAGEYTPVSGATSATFVPTTAGQYMFRVGATNDYSPTPIYAYSAAFIVEEAEEPEPPDVVATYTAFNPATAANATLSNDNRTMQRTNSSGDYGNVMTLHPFTEDTYMEMELGTLLSSMAGAWSSANALSASLLPGLTWGQSGMTASTDAWSSTAYGNYGGTGEINTNLATFGDVTVAPTRIQMAYRHDSRAMWIRVYEGGSTYPWPGSGDPETNSNPTIVFNGVLPVFPVGSSGTDTSLSTLADPSTYTGAVPTGFAVGVKYAMPWGTNVIGPDTFPASDGRYLGSKVWIDTPSDLYTILVNLNGTSGNAQGAVWRDEGDLPGDLLTYGAVVSASSVLGWKSSKLANAIRAYAGWYWVGCTSGGYYSTFSHNTGAGGGARMARRESGAVNPPGAFGTVAQYYDSALSVYAAGTPSPEDVDSVAPIYRGAVVSGWTSATTSAASIDVSALGVINTAYIVVTGRGNAGSWSVADNTGNSNTYTEVVELRHTWTDNGDTQVQRVFIANGWRGTGSVTITATGPTDAYPTVGVLLLDRDGPSRQVRVVGYSKETGNANPRQSRLFTPGANNTLAVSQILTALNSSTVTHTPAAGWTERGEITSGGSNWCMSLATRVNTTDDPIRGDYDTSITELNGITCVALASTDVSTAPVVVRSQGDAQAASTQEQTFSTLGCDAVVVICSQDGGIGTGMTPTSNRGGTFTQRATQICNDGTYVVRTTAWTLEGFTPNASHTITVDSSYSTLIVYGINKNGQHLRLDQVTATRNNTTSPYLSNTLTPTAMRSLMVMFASTVLYGSGGDVVTAVSPFTDKQGENDGSFWTAQAAVYSASDRTPVTGSFANTVSTPDANVITFNLFCMPYNS